MKTLPDNDLRKSRRYQVIGSDEVVMAMVSELKMKLINGDPVNPGDFVIQDSRGERTAMRPADFWKKHTKAKDVVKLNEGPKPPTKIGASSALKNVVTGVSATEHAAIVSHALVLGTFDRHDARSIEKAWLEVEAATTLLVKRSLQLQTLNGASRESAQASLRLREAAFWLSQRKQIVPTTVEEVKEALK